MTKLEQAARQIIDAWNYGSPFEKYLVALDEALAEQAEQSQLADASLEPVAWMQDRNDLYVADQRDKYYTVPLYAAPVRTKDHCNPLQDLTDDEIYTLYSEPCSDREMVEFARAVIAADRAKNNLCERTK